jgi:hypothetical protein
LVKDFNNLVNGHLSTPLQIHGVHACGDCFASLAGNIRS